MAAPTAACRRCRTPAPASAKFCGECGFPLSPAPQHAERRVVTVVFADLVGFTGRSEPVDVEGVGSALHRFHEAMRGEIERYGGVVEFAGDGVMGVFGAPVAHEDDPQRAAHAALAMRESADG